MQKWSNGAKKRLVEIQADQDGEIWSGDPVTIKQKQALLATLKIYFLMLGGKQCLF